jgi:hypothetical protein
MDDHHTIEKKKHCEFDPRSINKQGLSYFPDPTIKSVSLLKLLCNVKVSQTIIQLAMFLIPLENS